MNKLPTKDEAKAKALELRDFCEFEIFIWINTKDSVVETYKRCADEELIASFPFEPEPKHPSIKSWCKFTSCEGKYWAIGKLEKVDNAGDMLPYLASDGRWYTHAEPYELIDPETLAILQKQNSAYREELTDLKDSRRITKDVLRSRIEGLRNEVESLEQYKKAHADVCGTFAKIEGDCIDLKIELNKFKAENEKLTEQLDVWKKAHLGMCDRNGELKTKLNREKVAHLRRCDTNGELKIKLSREKVAHDETKEKLEGLTSLAQICDSSLYKAFAKIFETLTK